MSLTSSFSFNSKFRNTIALFLFLFSTCLWGNTSSDGYLTVQLKHPNAIQPNDSLQLSALVFKNNISGYAKLSLTIPPQYELISKTIPNAAISQKDSTVKILWIEIGSTETIDVNIKLAPTIDSSPINSFPVKGYFSYIFDNQVRRVDIEETVISVSTTAPNFAEIQKNNSFSLQTTKDSVELKNNASELISDVYDKSVKKQIEYNKDLKKAPQYSDIYDKNIVFKVQIAASKRRLSKEKLHKIYPETQKIQEEIYPNGWYKYTIGSYASYEKAHAEKLQSGVTDAFIVAQSGGKKIDIVSALRNSEIIYTPANNIVYKVQIAAHNKFISKSKLKKLYQLQSTISIDFHQGMNKYTTGEFFSYEEAQKFKKELHIVDAFIVAYQNGQRISIKEARKKSE